MRTVVVVNVVDPGTDDAAAGCWDQIVEETVELKD